MWLRAARTLSPILMLAGACSPGSATNQDASALDATVEAALPVDATNMDVPAPPVPYDHALPQATDLNAVRGFTSARSIIHVHSVHSHDACDNTPYVDGGPNEPCLQDFRRAICTLHMDVMFLTEHAGLMADGPFERVMQFRTGDEPVMEDGRLVGQRILCEDGRRVLLLPGSENALMPIGLTRHPDLLQGQNMSGTYGAYTRAASANFRAAGALVAQAHVEQRTIDELVSVEPDVIEIYNVHANIAPNIAGPYLGLDVGPRLVDLLRFREARSLEPDLALLTFFEESGTDLTRWSEMIARGYRPTVCAGSDAHQNAFTARLTDGERGDSYRRILHMFSNHLLVRGPVTRASSMEAVQTGRLFVAFEILGTPRGFDFHAESSEAGSVTEMGGRTTLASHPTLVLARPTIHQLSPLLPAPEVRLRILRAAAGGTWAEVASGTETLRYVPTQAGTYRAEVRLTPHHLRPYLPGFERLVERDRPWIYSNAIDVQ